jgi:hypothetical protein
MKNGGLRGQPSASFFSYFSYISLPKISLLGCFLSFCRPKRLREEILGCMKVLKTSWACIVLPFHKNPLDFAGTGESASDRMFLQILDVAV